MSIEKRIVIGDNAEERTAVITIAVPAGAEVEIDRTWRFEGWLLRRKNQKGGVRLKVQEPNRISIEGDTDDE